jgi:ankyrin repeat protein
MQTPETRITTRQCTLLGSNLLPTDIARHAAASYAHLELLDYLITIGGDINIADDDGETPLYTVESIDTARFLVSKGADVAWRNSDGITVRAPTSQMLC